MSCSAYCVSHACLRSQSLPGYVLLSSYILFNLCSSYSNQCIVLSLGTSQPFVTFSYSIVTLISPTSYITVVDSLDYREFFCWKMICKFLKSFDSERLFLIWQLLPVGSNNNKVSSLLVLHSVIVIICLYYPPYPLYRSAYCNPS